MQLQVDKIAIVNSLQQYPVKCRILLQAAENCKQKGLTMSFYIKMPTGQLTNSTGGEPGAEAIPRFCAGENQKIVFEFIFPSEPPADFFAADFQLTGSTTFNCPAPCFCASGKVDSGSQTVEFEADTYTAEYIENVTRPGTVMFCDLTRKSSADSRDTRIGFFTATADPRVCITGTPPAPQDKYYTADEVDQLLAAIIQDDLLNELENRLLNGEWGSEE